jgi:hypothetical protein
MNNEESSIIYCALLGKIDEINKLIELSQRHNNVSAELFWKELLNKHKALLDKLAV